MKDIGLKSENATYEALNTGAATRGGWHARQINQAHNRVRGNAERLTHILACPSIRPGQIDPVSLRFGQQGLA